jgi:hypothetical protein
MRLPYGISQDFLINQMRRNKPFPPKTTVEQDVKAIQKAMKAQPQAKSRAQVKKWMKEHNGGKAHAA